MNIHMLPLATRKPVLAKDPCGVPVIRYRVRPPGIFPAQVEFDKNIMLSCHLAFQGDILNGDVVG
jgi:hypothetical protein